MIVATIKVSGVEAGRRIIVPVAPRWQLFVLTKTQIIILILGSPLLHDMTALLGLGA